MTAARWLLLAALAGCTATPPALAPAAHTLPPMACSASLLRPSPPPAPRTTDQLFAWTAQLVRWGDGNAARLRECAQRLQDRDAFERDF